ncbi:MAG: hypothetical protein Q9160_007986 [Pyrenula sp. 1 TL-2023]
MAGQPDPYSQGVDDAQKTVTLAGAFVDLVRGPATSFLRRRSAQQILRERLGEWVDEAVDAQGRWLQPVLRTDAFENHLIRSNGHFRPTGSCLASFAWAHLLFALDIRPGRGVLSWGLPKKSNDAASTGQINLKIDGQVLCHVVNIYRLYTTKYMEQRLSSTSIFPQVFEMPFGKLSVSKNDSQFVATFESGTSEELSSARVPFSYHCWLISGTCLKFDQEVVIARYFNTIHHGVSDSNAMLPDASRSLKERIQALLRAYKRLLSSNFSDPYLLTESWLKEASRIKRRVTTDGGYDNSLADDIIANLRKPVNALMKLQEGHNDDIVDDILCSVVRESFMTAEDCFQFVWTGRTISTRVRRMAIKDLVQGKLSNMVEKILNEAPASSWMRVLADMSDDVTATLRIPNTWINRPGVRLELTPQEEIWNSECLIEG